MDGGGGDAAGFQVLGHPVGAALGAGEHDGAAHLGVGEQLGQQLALVLGLDEDQLLVDPLGGGADRRDRNLGRIVQQLARQLADLARHGGREEQVGALLGQVGDDAADRLQEAQVEHLVGLVEHENLGFRQVGVLLAQVVDQAAGGGDKDVDAGGQRLHLRAVLHAAKDHSDGEAEVLAVGAEALGDLAGQFAGGRQHQHPAAALGRGLTGGVQTMQDRQGEGGGLAGAGLGDAQQVAAGHDDGDSLGLNRGRGLVAFGGKRLEQGRVEAEVGELGHG